MFSTIFNDYWPTIIAVFFAVFFIAGKLIERNDRREQKSWMTGEGEILSVYQHPKLIVYYVAFAHQEARYYFEERRAFGDIAYNEGDRVAILFDSEADFLTSVPPNGKNVFSSKLSVGCQQAGKINDNNRSSLIIDILNVGLIVLCMIVQGIILLK